MANNYTQFSFAVPLETSEEIEWARRIVALLAEHDNGVAVDELDVILPDDEDFVGYDAEVDDDGLWIHADESGQPEHVVPLVQAFLRLFRPDGHVGFEWANTCSKPKLDEFGGGACLVTATNVQWMASCNWLGDRIAELTRSQGNGEAGADQAADGEAAGSGPEREFLVSVPFGVAVRVRARHADDITEDMVGEALLEQHGKYPMVDARHGGEFVVLDEGEPVEGTQPRAGGTTADGTGER